MPPSVRIAAVLVAFVALCSPAVAMELRKPTDDGLPYFSARLTRAYLPCTAPNTVSWSGIPACQPPVTSACLFSDATFLLGELRLTRPHNHIDPDFCVTGTYVMSVTTRISADRGVDGLCESPICTLPDTTALTSFTYAPNQRVFVDIPTSNVLFGNFEIVDATLFGPDGLPMAAMGTDDLIAKLGVAYPPCTNPDPDHLGCNATPWHPACDFNAASMEWLHTATPGPSVKLERVAGVSPLCTTGTYQVAAEVRATLRNCSNVLNAPGCTLVDRTVMMPATANGVDLDATTGLGLGGVPGVLTAQLMSPRIYDPTGALLASVGFSGGASLIDPHVTIKSDKLKIQAIYPPLQDTPINPARSSGATFEVTSYAGTLFTANIPADRWQLQLPLGERWSYKDPGGVIAGIRKASIRLRRKKGVEIGWDVRVDAAGRPPVSDAPSVNLTITVPLNGDPMLVDTLAAQRNRVCRVRANKIDCR